MEMKYTDMFKTKLNVDFVKYRRIAVIASTIVNLAILFGAIVWPRLSYGVDFAGGTELQLAFKQKADVGAVREEVTKQGFGEPTVQAYGPAEENQFLVRVERVALLTNERALQLKDVLSKKFSKEQLTGFDFDPEVGDKIDVRFKQPIDDKVLAAAVTQAGVQPKEVRTLSAREGQDREYTIISQGPGDKIGAALKEKFGKDNVEVVRTEYVGPQVGKQLRTDGILAVVYAIGMILIYVGFRFDFRFSPGVVAAIVHDAIVTLGYFVVTRREFNLTSITVILTVVGYSVNDTIVVYDRIRENAKKLKGRPLREIVNLSINEMIGRTILTSATTALSLAGLLIVGVGTIFDFAAAMFIGIISGTYSTWFIAAPLTIWLEEHSAQRAALQAAAAKAEKRGKSATTGARPA